MANSGPYAWKPVGGDVTRLGQIREWANHYHIALDWEDVESNAGGKRSWTSYPIIQGHGYPAFTGTGAALRIARGQAAELIYAAPGALDAAKNRLPSAPIARM